MADDGYGLLHTGRLKRGGVLELERAGLEPLRYLEDRPPSLNQRVGRLPRWFGECELG